MNRSKNIFAALVLLATFGITSCLKDSPIVPSDPSNGTGTNNVVEFQNSSIPVSYTSIYPQYDNGLLLNPDTAQFNVNVNYAGATLNAPQDIVVTLTMAPAALTAFNADQGTSYIVPPTDVMTVPATITIPKGSNGATGKISIKAAADFDFTKSYAIPLTITAASYGVVSTNFGTAIYSFLVKNQWDGNYTSTGYLFHPSSPRAINATYAITTVSPTQSKIPFGDLGPNGYYYAVTVPTTTGPVTNYIAMGAPGGTNSGLMTADNPGATSYASAAPNNPGTAPWTIATYNNTYDVTAKTFWLHAGYVASGGTSQNSYTRQVYEKMVRQ
jgi:hypothetical protein